MPNSSSLQSSAEYSLSHELAQESHYNNTSSHTNSSASSSGSSSATETTSHDDSTSGSASSTSGSSAPPLNKDGQWRVKLYELSQSSTWEDKGTGFIDILFVPDRNTFCIAVFPEDGEDMRKPLLVSPVISHDVYQLQQETLIVWTESDGQDYALSFQDARGCNEVWESIADHQKRLQETSVLSGLDDVEMRIALDDKVLPEMELKNLSEIEEYVNSVLFYGGGTDKLLSLIFQDKFLDKLLDMFEMAEDLNMKPELVIVYNIMKKIVAINDNYLYKYLLARDVCQKVVAVFEYDPEYVIPRGTYRNFLATSARFKKITDFTDSTIEEKIHQTFRAQYLKDVVLARIIEDPHFNALHSIIMFNQVSILNAIAADNRYLDSMCSGLQSTDTPREKKRVILEFVEEFCVTARSVHMADRKLFYRALATKGVFQELQPFLVDCQYEFRIIAANIIAHALDHDAGMLRSFILSQRKINTETLSEVVIKAFFSTQYAENDSDEGMKYHYSEIIRMLLDWAPMPPKNSTDISSSNSEEEQIGSDFINLFFSEQLSLMMQPFLELRKTTVTTHGKSKEVVELAEGQCALFSQLSDLICHMIRMHSGPIKSYVLKEDLCSKISSLLLARHGTVKLLPIRILRIIISCKDDIYSRYIIKRSVLRPVMAAFILNESKYNMFDSAVLELLDYIKNVPIHSLIRYIATEYSEVLKKIDYIPLGEQFMSFHNELLAKELKEEAHTKAGETAPSKTKEPWGGQDEELEHYFNEDETNGNDMAFVPNIASEEPPPILSSKAESDNPDELRTRITSRSPMLSKHVPSSITVRNRRPLVDYEDDTPTKNEERPVTADTSPRIRNITFGTKRMAIDEADSRTWNLLETGDYSSSKSSTTPTKISFKLASSHKTPSPSAFRSTRSSSEGSEKKKLRTDAEKD